MEIFDVHRRDIFDFDTYMDLKKPGFGGPSSAKPLRDASGKKINKDAKLEGYQNTVERHKAFSHPVFDPTYKAMSNDLVYKQEKKKPLNYGDPSLTGIPVVNMGDYKYDNETMSENRTLNFSDFLNEAKKTSSKKECKECDDKNAKSFLKEIDAKKNIKKILKKGKKKINESHFDDEFFHDYNKSFGLNPNDEEEEEHEEREDLFPENNQEEHEEREDLFPEEEESNESPEEEEEEHEETNDEYERPEEAEEDWEEKGPSKKDIQEIEALLKGFESDDEEEEEDAEERYKY